MAEADQARVAWDPVVGEAYFMPLGRMQAGVLTIGERNSLELQVGELFYDYCIGNNVRIAGPGDRANCEWILIGEEEAEARRLGLLASHGVNLSFRVMLSTMEDVPEGASLFVERVTPDYAMAPLEAEGEPALGDFGNLVGGSESVKDPEAEGEEMAADLDEGFSEEAAEVEVEPPRKPTKREREMLEATRRAWVSRLTRKPDEFDTPFEERLRILAAEVGVTFMGFYAVDSDPTLSSRIGKLKGLILRELE